MDTKKFLLAFAAVFLFIILHRYVGEYFWPSTQGPQESVTDTTDAPPTVSPGAEATSFEPTAQPGREDTKPRTDRTAQITQFAPGQDFVLVSKGVSLGQEEGFLLGSRAKGSGYKIEASLTANASIEQAWLTEFAGDSDEYKYAQSPYGQGRKTPVAVLNPVPGRFKRSGR